jgi:hypothetical protein
MTGRTLLRISAYLAILGGGLRIATAFVQWTPVGVPLEALYLVIDLALLFGLMGIYLAHHRRLGVLGLAGFAVAAAGLAFIAAPSQIKFGIGSYYTGVLIIAGGLALLSLQMLRQRIMVLAGAFWLASIAAGAAGAAAGFPEQGFIVAGVLFGLGFVSAGFAVARTAGDSDRHSVSG